MVIDQVMALTRMRVRAAEQAYEQARRADIASPSAWLARQYAYARLAEARGHLADLQLLLAGRLTIPAEHFRETVVPEPAPLLDSA